MLHNVMRVHLLQRRIPVCTAVLPLVLFPLLAGCGTTKKNVATQQLLASDAVDRAVARIDFEPLAGQRVYFDTRYIQAREDIGFVNANYVISSLRQQLVAAGCRLQDDAASAEYVVEARIGTLGNNEHEIVYGVPANNALATAASMVPNTPPLPSIPEISFARKSDQLAAAKIAAFAYHRETRQPVWQSGLSIARASAEDTWILGAGPLQRGTIYDDVWFAGERIRLPFLRRRRGSQRTGPLAEYAGEAVYHHPGDPLQPDLERLAEDAEAGAAGIQQVSGSDETATADESDDPPE